MPPVVAKEGVVRTVYVEFGIFGNEGKLGGFYYTRIDKRQTMDG